MNSKLQLMLHQAIQAFQGGNLDSADLILKRVLQIDSKNLPALHMLGLIKASQSHYKEAAYYLRGAARIDPNNASIQYNLAKALSDSGDDKGALAHHKKAVSLAPSNPDAWVNYGKSASNLGQHQDALVWYDNALNLKPDYAEALLNKGATLKELKRYEEAINFAEQALVIKPTLAEAWSNKGVALKELKRYDEAIANYEKALSLKPDYAEGWFNKSNTLHELKRYDEAITNYEKALSLKPDYAEAWFNKGVALYELKRYDEAITNYEKALSFKPDYAEAWSNKGLTLYELKRFDEAIANYEKALSFKPDYAEVWSNKGLTLYELKRFDEAIAHYDKALNLKPDYAECWSNKGITLNELKRFDEAIAHYDKALNLKPDNAEAWFNRGIALNELKRFDEAIAHYDKALKLKPDIDWAHGDLLHAKMKICSLVGLNNILENISKEIMINKKAAQPFPLLAINDDAVLHKKSSEIFSQSRYPLNPVLGKIPRGLMTQKIRVGYFSADFGNHPVSLLTAEFYELHDKNKFEIIAFSLGVDDKSDIRLRLSQSFNQFIDVSNMSDFQVAELSRNLEIDIAVDLGGHTKGSRLGIFAYQAAPIQVHWLGYPGTTGTEFIDYIVADRTIIPEPYQQFYTEKVVYLPDTYMVDDSSRVASSRIFTREECGIPKDKFVFCCFNNDYKFNSKVLDSWSKILKEVKNSILWVSENNEFFRVNISAEFERRGIGRSRLIFAKREELMADHLSRYKLADLFLDTSPYNAHTTALDALKANIPVITLSGQSFASRVAASLLRAIELPELIATSKEEYEILAIELALNPQRLAEIKLKLTNNHLSAPLFNTPLFTKNLEAAYIEMYKRYHAGLEPDCITIT